MRWVARRRGRTCAFSARRRRWKRTIALRDQLAAETRSAFGSIRNVGDVRQEGLICAIELVRDFETREPFPFAERIGHRVCEAARRHGLLTRPVGDVLVLMPPYCTTPAQLAPHGRGAVAGAGEVLRRCSAKHSGRRGPVPGSEGSESGTRWRLIGPLPGGFGRCREAPSVSPLLCLQFAVGFAPHFDGLEIGQAADPPQLREEPIRTRDHRHRADAAEHDGTHGAEQRRRSRPTRTRPARWSS